MREIIVDVSIRVTIFHHHHFFFSITFDTSHLFLFCCKILRSFSFFFFCFDYVSSSGG